MRTDPNRSRDAGRSRRAGSAGEPLRLWRTAGLDGLDRSEVDRLTESLARVELLGEPRWRAARSWDAAAASGIALRHLRRHGAASPCADVAMSAVLLHALRGCAACRVVVAHARRRLARARRGDSRESVPGRPAVPLLQPPTM